MAEGKDHLTKERNRSNVQVICRIRPPTESDLGGTMQQRTSRSKSNVPSGASTCRSRSARSSKLGIWNWCIYMNYIGSIYHSVTPQRNRELLDEAKYCVFTTPEESEVVIATPTPITGKLINSTLAGLSDVPYFCSTTLNKHFLFKFDRVYNEGDKQGTFYSNNVKELVQGAMIGQNATVVLFGASTYIYIYIYIMYVCIVQARHTL